MSIKTTIKPIRFAILAVPRSGSNMLAALLNTHAKILCHHELFNPRGIFFALHLRDTDFNLGTMQERDDQPITFLNRVWANHFQHSHIGLKMTYKQNPIAFKELLTNKEIKKIILKRENPIKTFVSHKISEKIDQWEVYQKENLIVDRPQINIHVKELYQRIMFDRQHYAEIEKHLMESNQSFLEVKYEFLKKDSEQKKLLEFLEIEGDVNQLQLKSIKQNSNDLQDLVANWEVFKAAIKGTELERFLY